jgi:UDP-N-acetylglucosamine diphosphorylase/glucosamine-1-phosphate N-acetyltransferase
MAAGKGKRMKNPEMPKVMYSLGGRPMVEYVVELALKLGSMRTIVIVGHQKDTVIEHVGNVSKDVEFVEQKQQLGTGHAVVQAEEALAGYEGDVLVLSGDVPLLTVETITNLTQHHYQSHAVATILTAELNTPTGYGRVARNSDGSVDRIVEEKDASPAEKKITEINSGIYLFDKSKLFEALKHIKQDNAQGEYYLTDVFFYFSHHHMRICAVKAKDFDEVRGVNTVEQLEAAQHAFRRFQEA